MRRLVLSSVLLPLVFAAPALAVPPTTEVTVVELGDFASVNTELCGFPIVFDESGSFKVKTFYDAEGKPGADHPHELQGQVHRNGDGQREDALYQLPARRHHVRGGPEAGAGAPKRVQGPRSRGRSFSTQGA